MTVQSRAYAYLREPVVSTTTGYATAVDVAIYRRLSQDRTGSELGIDRQGEDCHQLARRRGWNVVAEHTDNDVSASGKRHRPGFEALLADVDAGRVGAIIAWDLDRLTRNARDTLRILELGEARNLTVALVQGSDIDLGTPAGQLAATILAGVARHEITTKARRQKREVLQRAQAGKVHGGPRAHGYTANGLDLVADEAAAIERWYGEFLQGRSLSSIAREAGMNHSTVRRVLLAPRNAGLRVYDGQEYDAVWPAIVSREIWKATVAQLEDPARRVNTNRLARRHLGSGLYVCGRCGARRVSSTWSTKKVRGYKCMPPAGCSRTWRGEIVDDFIERAVRARLRQPNLADLLPRNRPDLDALRSERKALRTRLDSLASGWALGTLDDAQLALANTTVRDRLHAVEVALAEAGQRGAVEELLDHADAVEAWAKIPVDQVERRQRVIRGLGTIVLGPSPIGRAPWREEVVVGASKWHGDDRTWAEIWEAAK